MDLSDITCRCNVAGVDQQQVWKDITLRMHQAMEKLEKSSPPNPFQAENPKGKPGAESLSNNIESDPRLAGRA